MPETTEANSTRQPVAQIERLHFEVGRIIAAYNTHTHIYGIYHIHIDIYSLHFHIVNFRTFIVLSQSQSAYRHFTCEKNDTTNQKPRIAFFHVWEKRYVQSEAGTLIWKCFPVYLKDSASAPFHILKSAFLWKMNEVLLYYKYIKWISYSSYWNRKKKKEDRKD